MLLAGYPSASPLWTAVCYPNDGLMNICRPPLNLVPLPSNQAIALLQNLAEVKVNFGAGQAGLTFQIILAGMFPGSENVVAATLCHNSGSGRVQHPNIMLPTSVRESHPSLFRIFRWNKDDVSAITMTVVANRHLYYEFLKRGIEIEQTLSSPSSSVQFMFLPVRSSRCQPVYQAVAK